MSTSTKEAALHDFFNGFGIAAYESSNVPSSAQLPYLTYTCTTASWGDETSIVVNLWYRDKNNTAINAKARYISETIGIGGVNIPCSDGAIWIKRGSPFCLAVSDDEPMIRRRYINISAEYLTVD